MKIIFMRGIPGSWKTGWANRVFGNQPESMILSTTDYFCQSGEFVFDGTKLTQAHNWNMQRFRKALKYRKENIIIDNTNIRFWEMKKYINIMKEKEEKYHYDIFQKIMNLNPYTAAQRNIHNVPLTTILKMYDNFEHVSQIPIYK